MCHLSYCLQDAVRITEKTPCIADPLIPLETKERSRSSPNQRSKKPTSKSNGAIKGRSGHDNSSQPSVSHTNGPPGQETNNVGNKPEAAIDSGSRDSRATSIDRFSDVSRHSNSSRGYLVRVQSCFQCLFCSSLQTNASPFNCSVIVKARN